MIENVSATFATSAEVAGAGDQTEVSALHGLDSKGAMSHGDASQYMATIQSNSGGSDVGSSETSGSAGGSHSESSRCAAQSLIPLPHQVEAEVRRVVMKLNTEETESKLTRKVAADDRFMGDEPKGLKRPLRGVRAIGGLSECQCYYIDDRLHVKLDLILDPRLLLGEAHAIARLVRRTVLEECRIEGLAEVDVDLELDEKNGGHFTV